MSVAEKVETFKNFVNGRWVASRNGATFDDENPARRGSNIAQFQSSTPEDVLEAIDAAEKAFHSWRRTPLAERQQYIAEFLRLLKESREDLARIVTLENGKTIRESRAEVGSLGDDPDAGLGAVRARNRTADVVGVDRDLRKRTCAHDAGSD